MNKKEYDVLYTLFLKGFHTQRLLSEESGYSLGVINSVLKSLTENDYIDEQYNLTNKAKKVFENNSPKNAIILAAGYGMRMVPINTQCSKALIEVNGETLIERIIKQLHEVDIKNIYVVVGYLKEQLEYLIDEYGVKLLVNDEYNEKNNLHSLALASDYISNSYIVPCDIWCECNPFRKSELYSWYMVSNVTHSKSDIRVNRKMELVKDEKNGNKLLGISYLTNPQSEVVKNRLKDYDNIQKFDNSFWEDVLLEDDKYIVNARVVDDSEVVEINTYEQLRELDSNSNHLKSDSITIISNVFNVNEDKIVDIDVLKKGMTNRSFLFSCENNKYIMRIPGEGTDELIDRKQETAVYRAISGKGLCDDPVYINPDNGYKITRYLEGVRTCDPNNNEELKICMSILKKFHSMELEVEHKFNLFSQIEFYESLWNGKPSVYRDYAKTKEKVYSLKGYIEKTRKQYCLTHIDAVPDNFLFYDGGVQLTDWEYSGMQDPHVDIAMFCIYSLYDKEQVDNLINIYFDNNCEEETRIKIYCYIAVCGLLWSNWCEYKRNLGVEFGEYSIRQYRYAKEYYKIAMEEIVNESK